MKAIVLTCDRYRPVTDHMITSYQALWPDHPFRFRIPYQDFPDSLVDKFGDLVEPIRTPGPIKPTVLKLLEDIHDDEWVYWCIDDKYPIALDRRQVTECFRWTQVTASSSEGGLLFCRCRNLLEENNLFPETRIDNGFTLRLRRRRNYYQFWIHQFLRARFLRRLFESFPNRNFRAKEMDDFTGQEKGLPVKALETEIDLFVTEENYAVFGESTVSGRLTKNCRDSMTEKGIDGSQFLTSRREIIIGGERPLASSQ